MGGGPASSTSTSRGLDVEQDNEHDDIATHSSESDPDTVLVERRNMATPTDITTPPLLVYSKSHVAIHPSSYSRDNVSGWVAITKKGRTANDVASTRVKREYLLSWIPENMLRAEDRDTFVRVEVGSDGQLEMGDEEQALSSSLSFTSLSTSYSTHAWSIPLSSIYSISVTPPTLSNWYGSLQIHLSEDFLQSSSDENGQVRNLPGLPLYFHDDESPSTMLMMDRRSQAMREAHSVDSSHASKRLPSSWGGEDLLLALKKYANVVKSSATPHLYLVNPSQVDLEAHSVPLYEDELLASSGPNALLAHRNRGNSATSTGNANTNGRTSILHQSLSPQASTANSEALPTLDNLTFNVLSSFSRLTNRAKASAHQIAHPILSHPLSKPILKHLPPPVQSLAKADAPEYSKWAERAGVGSYDAARVYLARWARTVAEEGERARKSELRFSSTSGLSALNDDEDQSTSGSGSMGGGPDELGGPFQVLASTYRIPRPRSTRVQGCQPIVESEWSAWFDASDGKLMLSEQEARKRIFQRGLVEGARRRAWPFLLGVYPWDSTLKQREEVYKDKKSEYEGLKGKWFGVKEVTSSEQFVEEHHRIRIDCLRTDRTQPMFSSDASAPISGDRNLSELYSAQMAASMIDTSARGGSDSGGHPPGNYHTHKLMEILLTYNVWETELGYVQGMSDLASPLYIVLEGDETLVFWTFVNLMEERMKPNFYRDQSGMKAQLSSLQELIALMDPQLYAHLDKTDSLNLFFCFRWILIAFKREFKLSDCLAIWEAIWSAPCTKSFHLFIAFSILEMHRSIIMRYLTTFDEVLKYVVDLSGTLGPQPILDQAEILYLGFRKLVEATDRRKAERASAAAAHGAAEEGTSTLRRRPNAQERPSSSSASSVASGSSATLGSRDKVKDKDKEKDPLIRLVNDEAEAEARVPDINLSDALRALAI